MNETEPQTIDVSGEGIWSHVVGDTDCESGWCGGISGYPKPCPCGGLIHADFGDENWDGDYWLHTKCDKCGLNEWDAAHTPTPGTR